ncbi:alpha/beta-hydrolase [Rhizoclosmatium globosum]|uniref:Carboxypeptidase n=1 Tax=Rhizoclosmatium globosum TaxID=329046 RepID=A0A1Y2C042_9FUNG|nr:alpha/beta-hydrolase [Rhizoclosmatium globosum]|eukprot:ORY40247.1 alpha/beta-hydrolase [Rhizoclosmatium globosum]
MSAMYLLATWVMVVAVSAQSDRFTCTSTVPPNKMTKDSYKVTNLPNETESLTAALNGQYAGYMPIVTASPGAVAGDGLFFWYFPSMNTSSTDFVVWFNGGPGCSSLFGSFIENGPVRALANGTLVVNQNSWHKQANLVYIEQPLGTGWSAVQNQNSSPMTEYQVGSQMVTFLNGFYSVFPEAKPWNLYLTGESYAGTYIPYIATAIETCKTLVDGTPINLKGIGIGDGVLNFKIQLTLSSAINMFDYLVQTKWFTNDTFREQVASMAEQCRSVSSNAVLAQIPFECDMFGMINSYVTPRHSDYGAGNTCLDMYNVDYIVPCGDSVDHYFASENFLGVYFNTPAFRSAVHVDPTLQQSITSYTWQECNDITITDAGDMASGPSSQTLIPDLITAGVKVVIFNGDRDFVINYVGVEECLGNLTWAGNMGFQNDKVPWMVNGVNAGYFWNERGLTYIRVFDSGHMVPADQPVSGSALLKTLLLPQASATISVAGVGPIAANGAAGIIVASPKTNSKNSGTTSVVMPFHFGLLLAFLSAVIMF